MNGSEILALLEKPGVAAPLTSPTLSLEVQCIVPWILAEPKRSLIIPSWALFEGIANTTIKRYAIKYFIVMALKSYVLINCNKLAMHLNNLYYKEAPN